ncbi:histidine kinase [Actinomyces viscosus]|uniref:histidine kinase n=1 Tax=Actinomyces viscosus TaxID=1656 RepID=A0A3S4VFH7_ACTVI|nr:histidine kinase [Actinomyces viscosus]TFH51827.1 histidine kinase [Actinomyces viscosus]VEI17957.1 nitrate/nitrite sensor protein NarQ [Actinomyces viscosus]
MTDGPIAPSAHARRVQLLVWGGTASIAVAQTLASLPSYLRVEGRAGVVLSSWQALYGGHVLISVVCLLLLIPVLRRPHPLLPVLIVFLGSIPAWTQIATYVAATVLGMRKGVRAVPVVLVSMIVGMAMSPILIPEFEGLWTVVQGIFINAPMCVVCVMLGVNLQAREELLRSASREARLIRTTQEARIAQSRAEERARISREMHDSLAHRLSLVSLHAGALQTRTDLEAGAVRRIAGSIHALAADAGRELRQILAVLHDDGSADDARATWSDVEDVLAWEREAGQEIDLHLAESWAESFDLAGARSRHAVLRTVEELLANARRHGAGGVVRLDCEVEASDGAEGAGGPAAGVVAEAPGAAALVVRCVNSCPSTPRPTAPGGGLGLEGLRERLRLLGGELHVSQRAGQFVVMAAVPARSDLQ